MMPAVIDAEGGGEYADLDDTGRYKVIMPFDQSGRDKGKATMWLRMMQPYGGSNHGMHFPLHKGCEVAVGFFDGDPDRPYILGAMPNPDVPSLITSANHTKAMLTTAGGNKLHFEDKEGGQGILLHSPTASTTVTLGASDPSSPGYVPGDGLALYTKGWLDVNVGGVKNEMILGASSTETVIGNKIELVVINKNETVVGLNSDIYIGGSVEVKTPERFTYAFSKTETAIEHMKTHAEELKFSTGNKSTLAATVADIATDYTAAIAVNTTAIADLTTVTANKTQALGQEIKVAADIIKTHATEIKAAGDSIKAVGNCVKTMANCVRTAGINIHTAGTHMAQHGTSVHDAGTFLQNAGCIMANGLIMQN